jgi:hypothetical protein
MPSGTTDYHLLLLALYGAPGGSCGRFGLGLSLTSANRRRSSGSHSSQPPPNTLIRSFSQKMKSLGSSPQRRAKKAKDKCFVGAKIPCRILSLYGDRPIILAGPKAKALGQCLGHLLGQQLYALTPSSIYIFFKKVVVVRGVAQCFKTFRVLYECHYIVMTCVSLHIQYRGWARVEKTPFLGHLRLSH